MKHSLAALLLSIGTCASSAEPAVRPEEVGSAVGHAVAEALVKDAAPGSTATVTVDAFDLPKGDPRAEAAWRYARFAIERALHAAPRVSLRAAGGAYSLTGDLAPVPVGLSLHYRVLSLTDQRVVSLGAFTLPLEGRGPSRFGRASADGGPPPAPGRRWTLWGGMASHQDVNDRTLYGHLSLRPRDRPWEVSVRVTNQHFTKSFLASSVVRGTQVLTFSAARYSLLVSRLFQRQVPWLPGADRTTIPLTFRAGAGLALDSVTVYDETSLSVPGGDIRTKTFRTERTSAALEASVAWNALRFLDVYGAAAFYLGGRKEIGRDTRLGRFTYRVGLSVRFL